VFGRTCPPSLFSALQGKDLIEARAGINKQLYRANGVPPAGRQLGRRELGIQFLKRRMSLGTILLIVLIIALLGGFSASAGRF